MAFQQIKVNPTVKFSTKISDHRIQQQKMFERLPEITGHSVAH